VYVNILAEIENIMTLQLQWTRFLVLSRPRVEAEIRTTQICANW